MFKIYTTESKPEVTVTALSNGQHDVRLLTNETLEDITDPETGEVIGQQYVYDGNIFRTVYPLTAEDYAADIDTYLDYTVVDEPSITEYNHDLEIIDAYTLELIEEGVIA